MKYSITQWILGGEPLETSLERLKKYGFDGIELIPDPERFKDTKQIHSLFDSMNAALDELSLERR